MQLQQEAANADLVKHLSRVWTWQQQGGSTILHQSFQVQKAEISLIFKE